VRQEGQRGSGTSRPGSWAHRALGVGGRVLGSAGHALASGEHLATEALVAFVDGELGLGPHQRAAAHLAECSECSAEVRAQLQARSAVRAAAAPCTPAGLLGVLRNIPDFGGVSGGASRWPGGVVQNPDGAWVSVLRPEHFGADRSPTMNPPGADRSPTMNPPGVDRPPTMNPGPAGPRGALPLALLAVATLAAGVLAATGSAVDEPPPGTGPGSVDQARLWPSTSGAPVGRPALLSPQTGTSPSPVQAVLSTPARR